MSKIKEVEGGEQHPAGNQGNGGGAPVPAPVSVPAIQRRRELLTESQVRILMLMGEDPSEFGRVMESVLTELSPEGGMERQLAEQIGQTFWRMRRIQRMQDGLALKRIESKVEAEEIATTRRASQALAILQPFLDLQEVLQRRGQPPTAAEVEAFVQSRRDLSNPGMVEFIALLKALTGPLDKTARRAAMRQARALFRQVKEPYEIITWQATRQAEKVRSAENLAALMSPRGDDSTAVQSMEDANLRRLWRLTNTLAKIRQGGLKNKNNAERSRYMHENKGNTDKMPGEKADILGN